MHPASGTTPSGGNPPASGNSSNGGKKPADNTSDNSAAPTAPAKNVTIDMKNNTVLYEEAISSIRGKDIDVILNMGNSISWTINGSNIVADHVIGSVGKGKTNGAVFIDLHSVHELELFAVRVIVIKVCGQPCIFQSLPAYNRQP